MTPFRLLTTLLLCAGLFLAQPAHAAENRGARLPVPDEVNQLVTRLLLCAVLVDYREQARMDGTPLPDHVQHVRQKLDPNVCAPRSLDKAVTDARTRYATDPTVMLLLEPGALPLNLD